MVIVTVTCSFNAISEDFERLMVPPVVVAGFVMLYVEAVYVSQEPEAAVPVPFPVEEMV